MSRSSSGLGLRPFTAATGVRTPYGIPMNQYEDKAQVRSLIKQAYLINQVLDEYAFSSVLDVGTGPGIIKRVLVKQGKFCHTVEQYSQWKDFSKFKPEIDFRMGYYKDCQWEFPAPEMEYDCVVLARFFDLYHTVLDFASVVGILRNYSRHILILQNPKSWQLNSHVQKRAIRHNTSLWPIYVLKND
jgi:hypothetical protein